MVREKTRRCILPAIRIIGDGLQYPFTMFVLSKVINEYGNPNSTLSYDIADKYALRLLYVAIGVGLSALVEGICWTRTAERQTPRIRTEYLNLSSDRKLVSSTRRKLARPRKDKFSRVLEKTLELGVKQGFAKGLMMGSMGTIYVGWAFQAWVGTYLVIEGGQKGGSIFVAGINVTMGGLSVLGALPNLTGITEATIAATRIFEMINRVPSIDVEDRKGKAFYPSRPDTPVLQGLNLRIPAGKFVGLVGGSGSGKSTTIALLQRFYDPIEGEIFLDGYKIRRLQLKWLRSQMGLVRNLYSLQHL
ncbi:hypothetical protein DITRI_Ditri14bG0128500 [Diplodiscus trichospermus]